MVGLEEREQAIGGLAYFLPLATLCRRVQTGLQPCRQSQLKFPSITGNYDVFQMIISPSSGVNCGRRGVVFFIVAVPGLFSLAFERLLGAQDASISTKRWVCGRGTYSL